MEGDTLFRLRTGESRSSLRRGLKVVVDVYRKNQSEDRRASVMARLPSGLQGFIPGDEFDDAMTPDAKVTFDGVSVGDQLLAKVKMVQRAR